jgi:hypothetical protein
MAGIVQQRRECRNAATAGLFARKRGREGDPGHAFCQREETFATPAYGLRVGCGSAAADSPLNSSDNSNCARRKESN